MEGFVLSFWDIIWAVILMIVVCGILPLLGVCLGGVFVMRTRFGAYDPLLPPFSKTEVATPKNIDDIDVKYEDEVRHSAPLDLDELNQEIESIFSQRADEDPNNPVKKAHASFKNQGLDDEK